MQNQAFRASQLSHDGNTELRRISVGFRDSAPKALNESPVQVTSVKFLCFVAVMEEYIIR